VLLGCGVGGGWWRVGLEDTVEGAAGGGSGDDVDGGDVVDTVDGARAFVHVAQGVYAEAAQRGIVLGFTQEVPEPVMAGDKVEVGAQPAGLIELWVTIVADEVADGALWAAIIGGVVGEGPGAFEEWRGFLQDGGAVVVAVLGGAGADERDLDDVPIRVILDERLGELDLLD
jgi:hypothetical protein